MRVEKWYNDKIIKIIPQTQINDLDTLGKIEITTILIIKNPAKSLIYLEGNKACAEYLVQSVVSHLLQTANLDHVAQQILILI